MHLQRSDKDWVCDVRQEIEDVLQLVGDLVVHRQLPSNHLGTNDQKLIQEKRPV